jgi:hypothetical protein
MAIGLSYVDATSVDVEMDSRSFPCVRFSMPVYLKGAGNGLVELIGLFNGAAWSEGRFRESLDSCAFRKKDMSITAFRARYVQLFDGDNLEKSVFGLKQNTSHAIKMDSDFGVNVLTEEGFSYKAGSKGDYLVVNSTGTNDVVEKDVFEVSYQTQGLDKQSIPCPELLKYAIKKALVSTRAVQVGLGHP